MRSLRIILIILLIPVPNIFAQSPQELLTSGMANLKMQRYSESITDFTKYLETSKDKLPGYLGRAEAFINMDKWDRAISDFENAETLSPGKGSIGLARTYARMGNAVLATQYLENHLRSVAKIPEKEIFLDKSFEAIENSKEWRSLWRNDWYSEHEHIVRDVEYLIGNGSLNEALRKLNEQVGNDPENAELYHLMAKAYAAQGESKRALSSCDLALRYQKDNMDFLLTKSTILMGMKKYDDALKPMNRAIYLNPEHLNLYTIRAEIHHKAGDLSRALDDINHYLQFLDTDREALLLCGRLNQESGKLFPALENYNKLIDLDQGNPVYFMARGNAYFESGTYRYAISDFSMALDLDPANSQTYLNRGKSYLAIGDQEHACYDFMKALEKGNKEAADLLYKNCR